MHVCNVFEKLWFALFCKYAYTLSAVFTNVLCLDLDKNIGIDRRTKTYNTVNIANIKQNERPYPITHNFFTYILLAFNFIWDCMALTCNIINTWLSPRTSSLCSHIFPVLRDHWLYVCLHLKMEFPSCARGRQWCEIFHYHCWTASIKPRLLFFHSCLVSWGLPFLQFKLFTYTRTQFRRDV